MARITFSLDPWARLNGDIANEPFAKRYNVRWTRMAVNLLGTGVRECTAAENPTDCYSQPYLRHHLSQVGPAWVTDYQENWHSLEIPIGQVEGAKALAAELWLDPISYGWNSPEISAVSRMEFYGRPVNGVYELIVELTPDVHVENIEGVQILAGTTYWVAQQ